MRRAVFLDRDDTLIANRSLEPAPGLKRGDHCDPSRVRLLDGALEACRLLRDAGYLLIVISNQGVVARGGGTIEQVRATNERMSELLVGEDGSPLLDGVYFCPYHPEGTVEPYNREHPWRKPQPGMILAACEEHGLDPSRCWVVGDAERDLEAGRRAGISEDRRILVWDEGGPTLLEAALRIVGSEPRAARATATLRTINGSALEDEAVRRALASAARALGDRTGVRVTATRFEDGVFEIEVEGGTAVALGVAAELRRSTNAWARATRDGALWPGGDA